VGLACVGTAALGCPAERSSVASASEEPIPATVEERPFKVESLPCEVEERRFSAASRVARNRALAPVGQLRSSFFRRDGFTSNFPWSFRPIYDCLVTVFDAVILIRLAYRAERLVVQAGQTQRFFQLF
jgi:hypothetical protein